MIIAWDHLTTPKNSLNGTEVAMVTKKNFYKTQTPPEITFPSHDTDTNYTKG